MSQGSNIAMVGWTKAYKDLNTGEYLFDENGIHRNPPQGFAGEGGFGYEAGPELMVEPGPELQGEDPELGRQPYQSPQGYRYPSQGQSRQRSYPPIQQMQQGQQIQQGQLMQQGQQNRYAPPQQMVPAASQYPLGGPVKAVGDIPRDKDGVPVNWTTGMVSGSNATTDVGQTVVTIRMQHDFEADDMTFEGSLAGAMITSIKFGARELVDSTNGVSIAVFSTQSQMRRVLKGQRISAGLDITVVGTLPGAGTLNCVVFGFKPRAQ